MPELPEVEVVRLTLAAKLISLRILKVICSYPPIIEGELALFKSKVEGRKIVDVQRYAKYLIFMLEDGAILSHLRMEGKYFYTLDHTPISKHIHVIYELDNGYTLQYEDVRKFGRMEYKKIEEIYTTPPLCHVGMEANNTSPDVSLILEKFKKRNIPIKTTLLDQSILSGLGNIYVDEVLFRSKISPLRIASTLSRQEVLSILECSQIILNTAIEHKGTTIRSYTSSLGVTGQYQEFLKVHTKKMCPVCGKSLEKQKIGGRTSYFCLSCQR